MGRAIFTVLLLIISNIFMTLAWYGQVMFKNRLARFSLLTIIIFSWLVAFFEYLIMVPANRIGSAEYGGPLSIWQLKVIQEVVTLTVFAVMVQLVMKNQPIQWNHIAGFICLVLAVFFIFKN